MQHFLKIILIFASLTFPLFCWGQDLDPADLLSPNANLVQWKNGRLNAAYSTQIGDGNSLDLDQTNTTGLETNLILAYQEGNDNQASSSQKGQNNSTSVLQQGNSNTFVSTVDGSNLNTTVIQNGNNNLVNQTIENSTDIRTRFVQNGDNNLVEQVIIGKTNMSFELTQNGNGLEAKVIQIGQ